MNHKHNIHAKINSLILLLSKIIYDDSSNILNPLCVISSNIKYRFIWNIFIIHNGKCWIQNKIYSYML